MPPVLFNCMSHLWKNFISKYFFVGQGLNLDGIFFLVGFFKSLVSTVEHNANCLFVYFFGTSQRCSFILLLQAYISNIFYNHKCLNKMSSTSYLSHWLSRWRHLLCLTSIDTQVQIMLPAFLSFSRTKLVYFSFPSSSRLGVHWLSLWDR